jgi:hypothetical protein
MTESDCARLRELGAELALGIADGRDRAAAIAHADRCPACRAYLEDLTLVGDGLLHLVPAGEPPVGFENRVVRRLRAAHRPPSRRWLLAAACAGLSVAAGLGGWAVGRSAPPAAQPPPAAQQGHPPLLTGTLTTADHRRVGQVFAYAGAPSWVYMGVDIESPSGTVTVSCQLERRDGSVLPVGEFPLTNGYGYWGAPAPVDPATLAGARLVAADGTVLATAKFTGG